MSTPTVSIVMTYYKRARQFYNTLRSFVELGYGSDVEVIVVDDASPVEPAQVPNFPISFQLKIITMPAKGKWYTNPCIPFNVGLRAARGRIVLIQNAECCHAGDIVAHAKAHLSPQKYLSYSCYSLDEKKTDAMTQSSSCLRYLEQLRLLNSKPVIDGIDGWYNHSVYNPVGYHFCAAIERSSLRQIGYFDSRFARGVAFDDNEILERVKRASIQLEIVDDLFVVHQFHHVTNYVSRRARGLVYRNRTLLERYTRRGGSWFRYIMTLYYLEVDEPFRKFLWDTASRAIRRCLGKAFHLFVPRKPEAQA